MAAERVAKKTTPAKAPAPIAGAGAGAPIKPFPNAANVMEYSREGTQEWPEQPLVGLLGQLLTVQTDTLRILEKLLEVATRQADLVQAGTAETVAARREIATVATQITRLVDQVGPVLPEVLAKIRAIPTTGRGLLGGLLGSGPPPGGKGGHRR